MSKKEFTYEAMYVTYQDLIKAINAINRTGGESFYSTSVSEIKLFDEYALLIIKKMGSYPIMEHEFRQYEFKNTIHNNR